MDESSLWNHIAQLPWWIVGLYGYVFFIGIINNQSRNFSMPHLMMLPLLLLILASAMTTPAFSFLMMITLILMGLAGGWIGRRLAQRAKSHYHCPHCYPSPTQHKPSSNQIELFLLIAIEHAQAFFLFFKKSRVFIQNVKAKWIHLLQQLKWYQLVTEIDRSQLKNSVLVFWDEAQKRGLSLFNVKRWGEHTGIFLLIHRNKKYYFKFNPIYLMMTKTSHAYFRALKFDNKYTLKKVLLRHYLPSPLGKAFYSIERALAYGLKLGFPLVVKPTIASSSCHVFSNIHTKEELKQVIILAKQMYGQILVERHIPGDVYRAVIVGKSLVGCVKRQAAHVVGDGVSTIAALIEKNNQHPWRGEMEQLDCTLYKVQQSQILESILAEQNMELTTVLAKDQIVFLAKKITAGCGAHLVNVTTQLHPENKKILEQAHQVLNIPISGFDFICEDVAIAWQDQSFAIIENNSFPHIDAHHYPSSGAPINVAGKIWDFVMSTLD